MRAAHAAPREMWRVAGSMPLFAPAAERRCTQRRDALRGYAHRPCATGTSMHRTHRHSIATAPFRHDFDQRNGIGTMCGMHETVDADA
ncbi:hypothetical protein P350_23990 [Burkholderia cepacia JBK9]|uniref:Uncharacterized protein n=1 Tax=Burkholderia arboris TaxID=488730 RepID=A0ABZ3DSJ1_9BURK|nr:hypothetical protein [Burkholderia arboris]ALX14597.1 hypothetical protein P350_23990 [Burkholderia cepacia JBK9]MCA8490154.1 hypothetical protein [Burkholderia arboris]UTV58927.1 hypothetical protein NLX30_22590 [Burkholderia arboris]